MSKEVMFHRHLISIFDNENDLLAAVGHLHREGLTIADIQTPYPVHGIEQAAGLRRRRLGWVCAIAGLSAAVAMLGFQTWVSAVSWPLNVGGKPFASTPAFVPVMFEVGVLVGGLSSVLALFISSRMFPGKKAKLAAPGVTDDRFVVVLELANVEHTRARAVQLCQQHNAVQVEETTAQRNLK